MMSDADTVGVFQIESRAQMSMLPRLRPECFRDIVIEVAIVRPGPIQGKMVHPYLLERERRRKEGKEYRIDFPNEELRDVLGYTLGVPLFQEQAMRLAIVAAKFSPSDADRFAVPWRRGKRSGGLDKFEKQFIDEMTRRKYDVDSPNAVSIRFAASANTASPRATPRVSRTGLRVRLDQAAPSAVFCCAMLNSQPMGFYHPLNW